MFVISLVPIRYSSIIMYVYVLGNTVRANNFCKLYQGNLLLCCNMPIQITYGLLAVQVSLSLSIQTPHIKLRNIKSCEDMARCHCGCDRISDSKVNITDYSET